MSRQTRSSWCLLLTFVLLATGCQPTQPFFFMEDGDLSHYVAVSTDIDYPDVESSTLDEVTHAQRPLSLRNMEDYEIWELTLEEATRITLCNSQVMRQLGGLIVRSTPETISRTLITAAAITTTYDPALVETGSGVSFGTQFDGAGVESALAEFDAQLQSSVLWQKNDRPVNVSAAFGSFIARDFQQDLGNFNTALTKTNATGGQLGFQNTTIYDNNNNGNRESAADWSTQFEAFFNQPLLQGAGAQYNRIAGPQSFAQYAANVPNAIDGVMIARLRADQSLADFEGGVRNLMRDVEQAYWELYFAYRDLESRKFGRDSALATWKKINALMRADARGGSADREAQSRSQYFQFRAAVEEGMTNLFRAESRLRYLMGLSISDGRLIRPAEEPTTARLEFDWTAVHVEALSRRVEIRKQKWQLKRRELELIASRNLLLPRLDAVGRYRWRGAGDNLLDYENESFVPGDGRFAPGTSAFESLTSGDFQEWELGLQLAVPIGFRRQLNTVRHAQLLLARDRAIMQDLELEISHQIGDAVRDVELNYQLSQTRFNGRVAAEREVQAVERAYEANTVTLDTLLDAQRRRAEAESAYYRSLVDYNLSIMEVEFRKGSLLDFNSIYLAEGPWPGKAYFDALRKARQRDASMYLDYGFTRPNVLSRGPHQQVVPNHAPGMMDWPEPIPAGEQPGELPLPSEDQPEESSLTQVGLLQPAGIQELQELGDRPLPSPNDATALSRPVREHQTHYSTGSTAANFAEWNRPQR